MLVNPYQEPQRVAPYPGTRLLPNDLNLSGVEVQDPKEPRRRWVIESLHSPLAGRALGGIRAKLVDTKGFITFCNQRDLEVLIGLVPVGQWCQWAGHPYVSPEDPEWIGLCADEEDLLDDLQNRELFLRAQQPSGILVPPMEIVRRVHMEEKYDAEELHVLLGDMDMDTGFFPDLRLETIERRWVRSHRERLRWDRV